MSWTNIVATHVIILGPKSMTMALVMHGWNLLALVRLWFLWTCNIHDNGGWIDLGQQLRQELQPTMCIHLLRLWHPTMSSQWMLRVWGWMMMPPRLTHRPPQSKLVLVGLPCSTFTQITNLGCYPVRSHWISSVCRPAHPKKLGLQYPSL